MSAEHPQITYRERARALRERAVEGFDGLAARVHAIGVGRRALFHDRTIGGQLIAGALAFRLFVFLVPMALLLIALAGFATSVDEIATQDLAEHAGLSGITTQTVAESLRTAERGRWGALILGVFALYFASLAVAKALHIAHSLVWQVEVRPIRKGWRAALLVVGVALALTVISGVLNWIRRNSPGVGLVAMVLSTFVIAAAWLFVSWLLPHGKAPWTALIPGALLVTLGVEAMHFATVYYFVPHLESMSDLYGQLGVAITLLGWTYILGRIAIASAVLNATLWSPLERAAPESDDTARLAPGDDAD